MDLPFHYLLLVFSPLFSLSTCCSDDDGQIAGSMGVGAYMSRRMGPGPMISGSLTWAGFTYVAERFRNPAPKVDEKGAKKKVDDKKATIERIKRRQEEYSRNRY